MKPYSEAMGVRLYCSVCGGEGVAMRPDDYPTLFSKSAHSDPSICSRRLEEKARKLEIREQNLNKEEG